MKCLNITFNLQTLLILPRKKLLQTGGKDRNTNHHICFSYQTKNNDLRYIYITFTFFFKSSQICLPSINICELKIKNVKRKDAETRLDRAIDITSFPKSAFKFKRAVKGGIYFFLENNIPSPCTPAWHACTLSSN